VVIDREGGNQTFTASCSDAARNDATLIVGPLNIDRTAPSTVASTNGLAGSNGWFRSAVTVTLAAGDNASGVSTTSYSLDDGMTWRPYDAQTAIVLAQDGLRSVAYRSVDVAGNVEAARSVAATIDQTPPTVTYAGNLGPYRVDQQVAITCTATDATSGVASTTCVSTSAAAYTFPPGATTLAATAVDKAGNTGSASTTFSVVVSEAGLNALVDRFVSKRSVARSLKEEIEEIAEARGRRDKAEAYREFAQAVSRQIGRTLTLEQAGVLLRLAARF
jgi:hypothetical protein